MVLQNTRLASGSESLCDVASLFVRKNYSSKVLVNALILVEQARILNEHIDGTAKDRPGLAVNRMAVSRSLHVRTSFVDRSV